MEEDDTTDTTDADADADATDTTQILTSDDKEKLVKKIEQQEDEDQEKD